MGEKWKFGCIHIIVVHSLLSMVTARYQRLLQNVCQVGSPGYKADILGGCETYYYCHADGTREAFACPYGMMFDERRAQCDTWNSVTCPLPFGLLQEPVSAPLQLSSISNNQQQYPGYGYTLQPAVPAPSPYHVNPVNTLTNNNIATPVPQGNPMDFLAALLFPPLAGQQDLNDFVNTAPSGIRQSFMRVANEGSLAPGQLTPGNPPSQGYTPYIEPFVGAGHRPVQPESTAAVGSGPPSAALGENMARNRESPGTNNALGNNRRYRPSPAMNPNDPISQLNQPPPQMQGGPPQAYDTGPVPPHLLGGHQYMFGQLAMQNQTANFGIPPAPPQAPPQNYIPLLSGPNAQVEALRPLFRSLMQNPYQPHLRRMASLLATGTAMDLGVVSGKLGGDPMLAGGAAPDPPLTGKKNKPGKALDDGLVDAKK